MVFEETADSKAAIRFRSKHIELIKKVTRTVHFNLIETEAVAAIYFNALTEAKCKINQQLPRGIVKTIFTDCFNITDEFLIDRALSTMNSGSLATAYIPLEVWIKMMSLYLRGTMDEKIRYCFNVYDLRDQGKLTRSQMFILMSRCFGGVRKSDGHSAARDLVERLIEKMDVDGDDTISLEDFRASVQKYPELLQCLGKCLPDRASVAAVLATFTEIDYRRY